MKRVFIFYTRFLLSQNIAEFIISFRFTFYIDFYYFVINTL